MATKQKRKRASNWRLLDAATSPGSHALRQGKNPYAAKRAAALEIGGALGGSLAGGIAGAAVGGRFKYPATGALIGGSVGSMAGTAAGTNRAHKKGYYKRDLSHLGKSYTVSAFGVEHGY